MSNALHKKLHKLCKRSGNKKTEMLSNSNKNIDIKLCDISKTTKMKLEKCTKTSMVNCEKKRKRCNVRK